MIARGFAGRPRFEDCLDGRHFIMHEALCYTTARGDAITVPPGFITDLASIPRFFWRLLPPIGKYDAAAIIHDYLYRTDGVVVPRGYCDVGQGVLYRAARPHYLAGVVLQDEADRLLLEAMEDCQVGAVARRIIYSGVRLGGAHAFHQHPVAWVPQQVLDAQAAQACQPRQRPN